MVDRTVNIIIGCDCDQDRSEYGGTLLDVRELKWKGIEQGLENVKEIFSRAKDKVGNHAKVTWFIRSDLMIKKIYGSSSWCAEYYRNLWNDLKLRGDELSWHPHLTRWSDIKNCWYQEIQDKRWIEKCLREGHSNLEKELGIPIRSAKAGYYFHNNSTMKIFNDLGIRIDLSATPGIINKGLSRRGSFFVSAYDWKITPDFPYFPSVEDYRRPARSNEYSLSILECPISIYCKVSKRTLLSLSPFRPRSKKKFALPKPFRDRITLFLTMHPEYFAVQLKRKFKEAKSNEMSYLHAYFHPDELLIKKGFLSIENLKKNLMNILAFSKKYNASFEFLTATEFLNRFSEKFK